MRIDPLDPSDVQSWKRYGSCEANRMFVYRFFDSAGQLLYVGITWKPFDRWRSHRKSKAWWLVVAGVSVTPCADIDARPLERSAIHSELPLYNLHQSVI